MPAYDYDCAACGRRFEVVHGIHADPPTTCPLCGKGPIRKAITAAAIHYKGSGWAKKERRATATSGASKSSGEGSSNDGGSDSSSTDKSDRSDGPDKSDKSDKAEAPKSDESKATPAPAKTVKSGTAKSTD